MDLRECMKNKEGYADLLAEIASCCDRNPEIEILSKIYAEILYNQIATGKKLAKSTIRMIRNDLKKLT